MDAFIPMTTAQKPLILLLQKWTDAFAGLTAGFTTRLGGDSKDKWASLNCALHVADDTADVLANRVRVAEAVGMEPSSWTCAEQVHGCSVYHVTGADKGRGRLSRESALGPCDALITREKGLLLAAFFADCVPLFFLDPEHEAIAVAHAGWRGTALDVAGETVRALTAAFGSRPAKLLGAIGPAIGPCCYEVNGDVVRAIAAKLFDRQEELPSADWVKPLPADSAGGDKAMLDLKEANRQFMIKAGILPTNIEITEKCTSCDDRLFFSHRRDGSPTGRMAAWIGWKNGG